MVCPKGWIKALISVLWNDFRRDVYNFLTRGR